MQKSPNNPEQQNHEVVRTMTIKVLVPGKPHPSVIRKLIHDLTSASNAFGLLVEQLSGELDDESSEREKTKINQLRSHAKLNKNCIENICEELVKQLT